MQFAYILCSLIAGAWCSRPEQLALVQRHASVTSVNSKGAEPRAPIKLNRALPADAEVRTLYNELAASGDKCVHFPLSSDGCGASECSAGTVHHASCDWRSQAPTVTGTKAPYSISAQGYVDGSTSGCITALSCVEGMMESSKASLYQGDRIEAIYSALAGGDWFEVAMGLYQGSPGFNPTVIEKMIYRGSQVKNATASFTVPQTGDFFVRIFAASYDRTGGTVLGASLVLESEFEAVGAKSAASVQQENAAPPTPWPTPVAGSSQASASGDPHLVDIHGQKFDIKRAFEKY